MSCLSQSEKINGVSYVASSSPINQEDVNPLNKISANYVAIMPFAFIRDLQHPEIIFNTERQWFGETLEGAKQYIEELRKQDIKIMLKPQIWVWRGEFTGYIKMNNEPNWQTLESTYKDFILDYAKLAEETKAEIFCIGTELEKFVENRPDFWTSLIGEVKQIYSGKLTYAANWDEFKRTPFWGELDYIGIDAYFPVSDEQTPTVSACVDGWKQHKDIINNISTKYGKPVLFTEYGYRSTDFAAKEPWKSDRSMDQVNMQAQTNATTALFETFWKEPWFAGGFIWKWFHDHDRAGGEDNSRFTPQNKPVEEIIASYYRTAN